MTINNNDSEADNPINSPKFDSDLIKSQCPEDEEVIASFFVNIPSPMTSLTIGSSPHVPPENEIYDRKKFWIRLANTPERLEQAAFLVDRMYANRGYLHENIIQKNPHSITLNTYGQDGKVIGTVSIGMDSPEEGLVADEGYREELDHLRKLGRKICEFKGLAIDSEIRSRLVVARLFHIAMLYPWGLFGYTDTVIEVTPIHAKFYERMLGFKKIGKERICPRVNVTGVLMHLEFSFAYKKISEVGGLMDKGKPDKTLYPYFFSKTDSDGILGRLKRMV